MAEFDSNHWTQNANSPTSKKFVLELLAAHQGQRPEIELSEQNKRHFDKRSKSLLPPINHPKLSEKSPDVNQFKLNNAASKSPGGAFLRRPTVSELDVSSQASKIMSERSNQKSSVAQFLQDLHPGG